MVTQRAASPDTDDTIVALSSAAGPGARAIVRLSGRRSRAIAAALVPDLPAVPGRGFVSAALRLAELASPLPVDVYCFPAPRTYTGQELVELHLISCPPLVERVVAACLREGARAAGPGEFTLRAFLAGKLDLTRAEAVRGVIEADDRATLTTALTQLAGGMAQPLQRLRDDLLNLLADVEAGLDFADEDTIFTRADDLLLRLGAGLAHVTNLRRQLEQRALGQRPFRAVLAGSPNAGKSRLFNALVGRSAALVSAEPGTTRDYLEAPLVLGDARLVLCDTAGQRAGADAIETAAQALGREQSAQADLVLWCQPCDRWEEVPPATSTLWVIATKSDLGPAPPGVLATSAADNDVADLCAALASAVRAASHTPLAPSLSRCRQHVDACLGHLRAAHAFVLAADLPELLALEIRLALEELGAMVGAVYTDDLLDRIFSRFCIGK